MKKLITLLFIFCAALAFTGCGGGQAEPDDAVRAFLTALKDEDYAGAVAQLSASQRDSIGEELRSISENEDVQSLAYLNKQFGTSLEMSELSSLDAAEFFELALKSARESDPTLSEALDSTIQVEKPRMLSDDRAAVRVTFGNDVVEEFNCRMEAGSWRMDFRP